MPNISVEELTDLTTRALKRAGASKSMALAAAKALVAAEAEGLAGHGVSRTALYAQHLREKRVDGRAKPIRSITPHFALHLIEYWLRDGSGAALCCDIRKTAPHVPISSAVWLIRPRLDTEAISGEVVTMMQLRGVRNRA